MSAAPRDLAAERALDAASRLAAQQIFDVPLVLEAGAGTGKTSVLVARLLAWCLGPGWERTAARLAAFPERAAGAAEVDGLGDLSHERIAAETLRRVVAITFTEAAAAEMATRVGRSLVALRRGELPIGVCEELLPDESVRRERAGALLDALDQLVVRTIHAWCRRLLAAQPLEAGLHPRFEIDADERLQAQVVREVVEGWLAKACADRDPDLLALVGREKPQGPAEIEAALLDLVKEAAPAGALAEDPLAPERVERFCALLTQAFETVCAAEGGRLDRVSGSPRTQATLRAACDSLARSRARSSGERTDVAKLVAELQEIWEKKNVDRLKEWARGDFGGKEDTALGAAAGALTEAAQALLPVVKHLGRLDLVLLETARRVLRPLLDEASALLRQRGIESYSALLRDTRDLLRGSPAAAARVRRDIDQLLVDEFQDTDALQCEILRVLVVDAPPQERPGLFLVGDPKQSIYGWRSADLRAYQGFVARVEQLAGRARFRLTVNFRSVPAILDEVRRSVAPVMTEEADLQPPFVELIPCPGLAEAAGFREGPAAGDSSSGGRWAPVEHWVAWDWDAEEAAPEASPSAARATEIEARALARDVAALRAAGVGLGDVGILLRALSDVEVYLEALRDAGVPYVVARDQSFYERREITDAAALVRCLLDPHDHLALVTVLRSPLVGVPDAALLPLWRAGLPGLATRLRGEQGLADARAAARAAAAEVPADVPGLERIAGWEHALVAFLEALAELRRRFDEEPPDLFVESLRLLLCPEAAEGARYLGRHRVANLDRLLRDLVATLEESGGDAWAVLAHLKRAVSQRREDQEGRPRDAAGDAVQVMTIHGAKGLDFEHVYLMQCHKGSPPDRGPGARLAERPGGETGAASLEYELLGAPTLGFQAVARDAALVQERERVRLLYVALTRAKRRLVVSGRWPVAAAGRDASFADLVVEARGQTWQLAEHMKRLGAEGRSCTDAEGTRLRFPALDGEDGLAVPGAAEGGDGAGLPSLEALREESERLVALHAEAKAREERPFGAPASHVGGEDEDDEEDTESLLARRFGGEGEGAERPARPRVASALPARRRAQAAGTLVHHVLEMLPFGLDPAGARSRAGTLLAEAPAPELAPEDRSAAVALAHEILEAFFARSLFARWSSLGDFAVARELAVVVEPGAVSAPASGPVGFVSGAVDLLYRDPASGELVVADYKTDAALGDAELRALADRYRAQGAVYRTALQRALGLAAPPRFELWFLRAGRVEPLEP